MRTSLIAGRAKTSFSSGRQRHGTERGGGGAALLNTSSPSRGLAFMEPLEGSPSDQNVFGGVSLFQVFLCEGLKVINEGCK